MRLTFEAILKTIERDPPPLLPSQPYPSSAATHETSMGIMMGTNRFPRVLPTTEGRREGGRERCIARQIGILFLNDGLAAYSRGKSRKRVEFFGKRRRGKLSQFYSTPFFSVYVIPSRVVV